jgi:hypothetical protein
MSKEVRFVDAELFGGCIEHGGCMLAKAGEVEGEASLRAAAVEVLRFVGVEVFRIGG